ncbi:hypothetical protein LWI29_018258 [Acer saccharum]|uniref:non-specific serine/threonine protein kinase n=1 Tax=Acer saccharum TaxID=4024 RepID=A0AA39VTD6_ACESA|nr:hypothetical protein LWI29_018258 [Acer saccharum]
MMGLRIQVFLLSVWFQFSVIAATTDPRDFGVLQSLRNGWQNTPPTWRSQDPCSNWDGIECVDSRVTSITLSSIGLTGQLSSDITALSELQILDLSYNTELTGTLPPSIGDLKKLTNLILIGCSFHGPIPDSIGSLPQLFYLSINLNKFSGPIPPSIGNLSRLFWLDLADNQLSGQIPVSDGTSSGLDMLVNTEHFHLGNNQLSGEIPDKLFNSDMALKHVLFENNSLTGMIPSSLGLAKKLEVIRFDRNSITGPVPRTLSNLTSIQQLFLSNNKLNGSIPSLAGMNFLSYLDTSNNSFNASEVPLWFSSLLSLTTLIMENTQLQGQVPSVLFSLPNLQTVVFKNNNLSGTLNISTSNSNQLQSIDLRNNSISDFPGSAGAGGINITLDANPICEVSGEVKAYCMKSQSNSSYSTPLNNCQRVSCGSGQISSPTCKCAYPYTGILNFRAPSFSDLENTTYYTTLEGSLTQSFQSHQLPVDSVSLSNPRKNLIEYLQLSLEIFPSGQDHFNWTGISSLGFALSNQTYKPPRGFEPYFFFANPYPNFAGDSTGSNKSTSIGIIIGAAVGGSVLLFLLLLAGVYAYRQKRKAERATDQNQNPFASWDPNKNNGSIPQVKGTRSFSFEELSKYSNKFSDDIGSGGYGKVYRGTLPTGEQIAIKRAQQGSMQGGLEFKTEIELLSRVHHKNVVRLLGFCFQQGEQMLIYDFVPNGSLKDNLSGKSGMRLDWTRRLKIALGAARGLAYLHELADPPIIHRDVKSTNILLDEQLNARVADFGLSKLLFDSEKSHVTTQVKGTLGYLDPEYYMTNQLTEKSDVYSFGVMMLELITARSPIERGKNIVREMKMAINKEKDLYSLSELIDPNIGLGTTLKGFEQFVDLAMKCVEESGADRPTMSEVVKKIENILELAGLNPNAESATTSATYEEASKGNFHHPYSNEAFVYSGSFVSPKIEPH